MGGRNGDGERDTIRAHAIEIVDRNGAVRGRFGMLSTDVDGGEQLGLEMCGDDGTTRLSILIDAGGEPLVLVESQGNARMVGGIDRMPDDDDPDDDAVLGGAYIVWCDDDGRPVAGFRCRPDGSVVAVPEDFD